MNSKFTHWTSFFWIASLASFLLFYKLGSIDIASWDEARHVISAVEMHKTGDYLVTTHNYQADYWNLKPPLSVWGILAGIGMLGETVFATRLCSVLASLGSLLLVFELAKRFAGTVCAVCAVLLCLGVDDMMLKHGLRSADADALFIFFVIASFFSLSYFNTRGVCLSYICLGLAFLAKSFHVAPFGLAVFIFNIYLVKRRRIRPRSIILAPLLFLLPVLPWAVARFAVDGDKFLSAMFFNDVLRRSADSFEGHNEAIYYFVRKLYSYFSVPFLAVLGVFLYNLYKRRQRKLAGKGLAIMLSLWLLIPLALYTASQSKLTWYIYPAVPAMALLISHFSVNILRKEQFRGIAAVIIVFALVNCGLIAKSIYDKSVNRSPVIAAIAEIGQEYRGEGKIFLETSIGWTPNYLATAKLLTNLEPGQGDLESFCRSRVEKKFLISQNKDTGEVTIVRDCEKNETITDTLAELGAFYK